MRLLAIVLVAAVEVGSGFGSASVTVEELGDTSMTIDIEVAVRSSAQAVVAHLTFGGAPSLTLPLLDRGGGRYGIRTELDRKNYVVVFEAVGEEGVVSDAVTLTEMGVDLTGNGSSGSSGDGGDEGFGAETRSFGWLALALGAAALSALAFWALGGRDNTNDEEE